MLASKRFVCCFSGHSFILATGSSLLPSSFPPNLYSRLFISSAAKQSDHRLEVTGLQRGNWKINQQGGKSQYDGHLIVMMGHSLRSIELFGTRSGLSALRITTVCHQRKIERIYYWCALWWPWRLFHIQDGVPSGKRNIIGVENRGKEKTKRTHLRSK